MIDIFLANIKNKFVQISEKVLIKCNFALVKLQPAPAENRVPITNIRWGTTNVYKAQNFHDCIHFSLKRNIKESIIFNVESRSSWRFTRFSYINFKNKKGDLKPKR